MDKNLRYSSHLRWIAAICLICFLLPPLQASTEKDLLPIGESIQMTGTEIVLDYSDSYVSYIASYSDAARPDVTVEIDASMLSDGEAFATMAENYAGNPGISLLTPGTGAVEWTFTVPETGLYCMKVEYYPIAGKGSPIVRSVRLDGKLPFNEAMNVTFFRSWRDVVGKNGETIQQDPNGNDLRPTQVEDPHWMTTEIRDSSGLISQPLSFYFEKGEHQLEMEAVQEPMAIRRVILYQPEQLLTAEDIRQEYQNKGYEVAESATIKLQAEKPSWKTDAMMMPSSDRSSPAVEPNDAANLRLNIIGKNGWTQAGSSFTYKFTVEKAGLYQISLKTLQNFNSGSDTYRRIMVDGEVLFKELDAYCFPYQRGWQMTLLGDQVGAFPFYLEPGEHTLTMENTLGTMSEIMSQCMILLTECNAIYSDILVLTGPTPDVNRDYKFDVMIPQTLENMELVSSKIKLLCKEMELNSSNGHADIKTLVQMYTQLDNMLANIDRIADRMSGLQNNLDAFGSWINTMKSQPLAMDYILIAPLGEELPDAEASFWSRLIFHLRCFFASFFTDYSNLDYGEGNKTITVWVGSGMTGGRDQAQIIKSMADDSFTPQTGISVSVQLVSMGALLPATLAGKGPDVVLSLGAPEAANYSFRGAAMNLREFPDFDQVAQRFAPSALTPLSFEDTVYALPETQTFLMMFYRKDILQNLGIDCLPSTWDEVIALLPILQKKQLEFGLPNATGAGASCTAMYYTFLMQYGGSLYSDDNRKSRLDSDESVDAMTFLTDLYTQYQLQQSMDFLNRFRSGSAPIGIADYTLFNQLSVFAPELNGLWGFAPVPGTVQADGTVNDTVLGSVTGSIILSQTEHPDEAWEFIKWWTDASAQITFGQQLESIMGTAARYPTANQEAVYRLAWTNKDYEMLMEQWKTVKGIPEVPGGYLTGRYVDFAFRDVVLSGKHPNDSLLEAAKTINEEIAQKRAEFKLDGGE